MTEEIGGCAFRGEKHDFDDFVREQRETRKSIELFNVNLKVTNEKVDTIGKWAANYIDRTMPIRSHFYILLGSLSILGTFAAVMQYLDKVLGH